MLYDSHTKVCLYISPYRQYSSRKRYEISDAFILRYELQNERKNINPTLTVIIIAAKSRTFQTTRQIKTYHECRFHLVRKSLNQNMRHICRHGHRVDMHIYHLFAHSHHVQNLMRDTHKLTK